MNVVAVSIPLLRGEMSVPLVRSVPQINLHRMMVLAVPIPPLCGSVRASPIFSYLHDRPIITVRPGCDMRGSGSRCVMTVPASFVQLIALWDQRYGRGPLHFDFGLSLPSCLDFRPGINLPTLRLDQALLLLVQIPRIGRVGRRVSRERNAL